MALKLKPLGDRLIIEPITDEVEKSAGGIYIPDTAKEKPQKAKVVAVGPGRTTDDGKLLAMSVKSGEIVMYAKYAGTEYADNGTEYLIVRESDVLGTVAAAKKTARKKK